MVMSQVLVIGYGNPLRADDGLGWTIAAELFCQGSSPALEVLPCQQLTPELASSIRSAQTVIFVDCAHEGTPGDLHCVEVQPRAGRSTFTHELTPSRLLSLAGELFGVRPPAHLLSITGDSFEPGDRFSAAVAHRIPDLKAKLHQLIDRYLACPTANL
jgi:hydrogenase maturation protease